MHKPDYVKLAHNLTGDEKENYFKFLLKHGGDPHLERKNIEMDFDFQPGHRNLVIFHQGLPIGHFLYSVHHPIQSMAVTPRRSFSAKYGLEHTPGLELFLHAKDIDDLRTLRISGLSKTGTRLFQRMERMGIISLKRIPRAEQGEGLQRAEWEASITQEGIKMRPRLPLRKR